MTKEDGKCDSDESNRMWASASFVGVLIIIGLPLWWKTTEVYRVSLPYDKISEFDTESHSVVTHLSILAYNEQTAAEIIREIEKEFQSYDVIKLIITKHILPDKLRRTLDSVAEEQEALEEVAAAYDIKTPNTFHVVQRKPLFQDVWVGAERVAFFRDDKAGVTVAQVLSKWIYEPSVLNGARSETPDAARQLRFPGGPGYHIVLSVVHPRPQDMKVDFQAGDIMEDYIGSFVDELSDLHNFTLKSQWLHLLDFDFQAKKVSESAGGGGGGYWVSRAERLPQLLTRLEERAAAAVAERATLNLALYAVPCHTAPLLLRGADDKEIISPVQAFLSPKWGGVVLGSPSEDECRRGVHRPHVTLVMGTFISHLRKLLGITDKVEIKGGHLEKLRSVSPRRWEIDTLLRLRTLEHITSAERSLKSLAKLLGEISNIVINDEVGLSINSAVENIRSARELLAHGAMVSAYRTAQAAFLAAETAFMEPSLLALLYFPDDQKYAIYIPLFLPIMFPVVLSLKNLFLWFRGKSVLKEKID